MTYLEELTNTRLKKPRSMADGISSMILQIRKENIKQSLSDLDTMKHRQDYIATVDGVMYYDDSKAESVNATWFTFESILNPVVWIAGGDDSHTDFSELRPAARNAVRSLICIGDSSRLKAAFKSVISDIYQVADIEEAVQLASLIAKENDIVLFSPACHTGTGMESNEQRGNRYIESVKQLENERNQ